MLQYAGDSLLAAFGADEAHEDDAERAVRAGLAILDEARAQAAQVRERHGHAGFNVRVGINTGPVLLGGGVDAEGSIRGITVNIAARMEQTAPPGALRISHDTWRHVRGVFDVSAEPPIAVKGIDEPVRSYLVQRAKPRAFRLANRGIEGVETRMIGRDAELTRLTDAFEAMLEDGELAFGHRWSARPGWARAGCCSSSTTGSSCARKRCGSSTAAPSPTGTTRPTACCATCSPGASRSWTATARRVAQAKLAAGLRRAVRRARRGADGADRRADRAGLQPEPASSPASRRTPGRSATGRSTPGRSTSGCCTRARGAPIVLLLDDLHWADDGSLDFVNHLLQACSDLPLMVLCLTRPTLYERRPLWGSGQGNHERIDLAPLSKRASRELADALLVRLDPVPAALRDLLTGSAEGNPFFVEELVGMLIDDGVIVTHTPTDPERWQVVPDKLLKVHVPPTLTGLLQARLDGLPPQEKAALQQASVIGHVFWDEPLERIDAGRAGGAGRR